MRHALQKLVGWLTVPAGLAGGMLGAALGAVMPGGTGLPGFVAGWLYGVVIGALVRLFRVPPGAYPLVGLVAGPLPFALLMPHDAAAGDRGVIWVGLVAGLILGCVEWAHAVHRRRAAGLAAIEP
jgi:hypothetical protein